MSIAKGVFFINLRKKILRVVGYIFCALLIVLCILLVISAAAFGSRNTVSVFGYNIYMVQTDGLEGAPKGSAVIVEKTTAFELSEGKLVLYSKDDDGKDCALGYVRNIYVVDGTYYMTLSDNTSTLEVPETRLVGLADYASVPFGKTVDFIKTPFGVFCVAVLPCIALILYDIIRAAAKSLPDPEVEPQLKNRPDEERKSPVNISVKSDGKAAYSRAAADKSASEANGVLFSYSGKQQKNERPIIPLTNRNSESSKPAETPKSRPVTIAQKEPKTPETVGIGRYLQNSENSESKSKTAELPELSKKDTSDAFFAQTSSTSVGDVLNSENRVRTGGQAPQIGRQIRRESDDDGVKTLSRPAKTAGKRSSQILASKRVEDLIDDDEDIRDKNRISDNVVDDILAGLKK